MTCVVVFESDSWLTTSWIVSAASSNCLAPTTSAAAANRRTVIIGKYNRQSVGLRCSGLVRAHGSDRWLGPFSRPNVNWRSEEHTSELQSRFDLVCRLLLEKTKRR